MFPIRWHLFNASRYHLNPVQSYKFLKTNIYVCCDTQLCAYAQMSLSICENACIYTHTLTCTCMHTGTHAYATCNKMMHQVRAHMDMSVTQGKVYFMRTATIKSCPVSACSVFYTRLESVSSTANSIRVVATACGAGLTASVCRDSRKDTPASCQPVREGT